MSLRPQVQIVEVGPRDGLQNERKIVPTSFKVELVNSLVDAGLKRIEVGSFVSPKHVPQMADSSDVFAQVQPNSAVTYSALVANRKGLETALQIGVREIAVFAAASQSFSRANINCSIAESLLRYREIASEALRHGVNVRGYVSCVLGCPYEGFVPPATVASVASELFGMGCFEVSLGDTIGSGTPATTSQLLEALLKTLRADALAVHFHDTGGRALQNIEAALACGIRVIDGSVGGLGGCPFAPGSPGNVATEQVVSALHARGFATGIDPSKLAAVAERAADMLAGIR